MKLQVKEKTATDIYEKGVVAKQRISSIQCDIVDGEQVVGRITLTGTGININLNRGLGDDISTWEKNMEKAFNILNGEAK